MNINKKIRRISRAQEERTAKALGRGGRTRPGSGAFDGAKGDVITGRATTGFNSSDFLVENKFTFDAHYILKIETWEKIANEALRENFRIPLMQIDLAKGTPGEVRCFLLDFNDFIGLELDRYFPHVHKERIITRKSFRLNANHLIESFTKIPMYREHIVLDNVNKTLVLLDLSDFQAVQLLLNSE